MFVLPKGKSNKIGGITMKIKTIISLITVATMLQTGVSAQAKFVEQESTITLNANGGYLGSGYIGTKTEIELETEKGKIKLPLPYRTSDYDFEGWYTKDGEKVTSKTEYYEDTTLNAKWNIIGQRTITFATDGGSDILPLTTKYGDKVSLENVIPTKQGFAFKGWYTDPRTKQNRVTEITMTENITVYAKWEQISNTVNTIGKDRIYMTDEEIEMRKEILKRQYPPTFSNDQITKLIQLLKQTEVQQPTPQPTQTAMTYIEGFGYVPQGNATKTTIGNSTGDIDKIVANME